ncbi:MAG: signal recognition particle-docking protein FtsY [Eubacteriales bacterium]|nr:signal recognition particle-docking protein FtsY [Eubacteriales bacterium]MDD4138945.1 signal recognition particle-docking protein FtsY [Eubacteriales bacterium]MDD4744376.1 signal recognition particle-docking protein FtsY [Eubacteriales bacterium]
MGLLDTFRRGLKKTRDFVTSGFNRIAASMGHFDDDMLDELEMLLVQADVGMAAAEDILARLKARIKAEGDSSRAAVMTALRAILRDILGDPRLLRPQKGALTILLMVGVNGTGKTTTAGKLCHRFGQDGLKVMLAAADTFRAAAIEQLSHWGDRTGTPVVAHQVGADPAAVVFDAISGARARRADVLIVDTAGRLHNKQNLMDELGKIRRVIAREAPDAVCETLLVIDATTGQNAVQQAKVFRDVAAVTGLAITKLDGNAKGGVAIAVAHQTRTPLVLAGLGEGLDDLTDFDPDAFVDALLPADS